MLQAGDVVEGVVQDVQRFGAFVRLDWGETVGLLHCSQVSHHAVKEIRDVFSVGDRIKVSAPGTHAYMFVYAAHSHQPLQPCQC